MLKFLHLTNQPIPQRKMIIVHSDTHIDEMFSFVPLEAPGAQGITFEIDSMSGMQNISEAAPRDVASLETERDRRREHVNDLWNSWMRAGK